MTGRITALMMLACLAALACPLHDVHEYEAGAIVEAPREVSSPFDLEQWFIAKKTAPGKDPYVVRPELGIYIVSRIVVELTAEQFLTLAESGRFVLEKTDDYAAGEWVIISPSEVLHKSKTIYRLSKK